MTSQYHGTTANLSISHHLLQIRQATQGELQVRAGIVAGLGNAARRTLHCAGRKQRFGQYSSRSTTSMPSRPLHRVHHTASRRRCIGRAPCHATRPRSLCDGAHARASQMAGSRARASGGIRALRVAVTAAPAIIDNVVHVPHSCVSLLWDAVAESGVSVEGVRLLCA